MDWGDLGGILFVTVVTIVAGWVIVRLLGPLSAALAERIRTRQPAGLKSDAEFQQLRAEVSELRALVAAQGALTRNTTGQIAAGANRSDV